MYVLSTLARLHCITFCLFISSTLTLFPLDAGLVCDRGLTLGDLIGVLNDFFSRLG
jgi:hypothetical protein